jgi:hypothetical protein
MPRPPRDSVQRGQACRRTSRVILRLAQRDLMMILRSSIRAQAARRQHRRPLTSAPRSRCRSRAAGATSAPHRPIAVLARGQRCSRCCRVTQARARMADPCRSPRHKISTRASMPGHATRLSRQFVKHSGSGASRAIRLPRPARSRPRSARCALAAQEHTARLSHRASAGEGCPVKIFGDGPVFVSVHDRSLNARAYTAVPSLLYRFATY